MSYPRIASRLFCEPWCIEPATWRTMADQFEAHLSSSPGGRKFRLDVDYDDLGDPVSESPAKRRYSCANGVALLPFHGVVAKHLSMLESMCGGADLAKFEEDCDTIAADPAVRRVVIDFRSPGGAATGLTEASAAIMRLTATGKHVTAFADEMCCSAAYWLAAACDTFVATASARIGSISTLWAGIDDSRQWEAEGIQRILLVTGRYKAIGMSGLPMTEDHLEEIRRHVSEIDAEFKSFVSTRRGLDRDHMQGQTWRSIASPAGLIDGIVESLPDLLSSEMLKANGF